MRQRIAAMFDGDAAGFLTGILTGDKSALSEQAASDLSEAGLYHLLAVSGMHCGFLLIVVQSLAGRHRRRLVAACAIPLLVFYAMLAGGSPSVTRACVMLAFLLAAPLFHRDSDGPTALTAALLLILLKNPFAAASVSLQLSFGAMAGILWLTGPLYWMLLGGKKRGRVYRFIASSFSATMDALALTIPISAWYFGIVVLISPLSNLLCLWFASVVFMAGLIAVLVSFAVPFLGMVLGILPGLFIRYILAAAHLLANIPYHAVYTTNPYLKYWLAFAYLLFILAWLGKPKIPRKYALATVLTALALVVTVCLGKARYQSAMDAIVLDVGQGESVLLASDGAFALVDCGSANSWYDAGGIAADHLMSMGCKRLDYLLLSHYDSDHVNGVECLLSRLPVETLLVPSAQDDAGLQASVSQLAENHGVTVRYITDLEELSLGRAHLTVYPPVGEDEDNDQGLSLLATAGETDLLLTGDMDAATERKLLASYDLPDVEYLVAGHHGSKYSTSADLLDAVTPEAVCISVGTNSYGHPADETVRRVAERGCAIYRTDMHGNIHLIFN
jgi:competence protein ComEC